MYARTYFGAIPLTSYTNAGNLADFMPSVWASIRWADIVFPLITGVTIWVLVKYSKRIGEAQRTNRICYLSWLGIFLLITLIAYPTPGHYKKHLKVLQSNAYAYQSIPAMYTVPGNLIFDALVAAEELTPQERSQTITFINSLPGVERLPEGVKAPKNLVFVFCESLESWVIGMDYYGQQVTPNLNRAIADSTTYYNPHVLSQAKDGRSIDGQLLDFTGLYPLTQGTYATIYADDYFPSIHKALKQDRGSYNVLLTGDKEYAWNQGRIARSFGMDTLVTFKDFRIEDSFTGRRHIGDRALMRQIVENLRKETFGSRAHLLFCKWLLIPVTDLSCFPTLKRKSKSIREHPKSWVLI